MRTQKTKNNYIQTLHLNNVISTKGNILSYIKLSFSPLLPRRALIDTGACANVIGKSQFEEIKNDKQLFKHIETEQTKWKHVKMAGGQSVEVLAQVLLTFKLAHITFTESFIVFAKSNSIILGNEFFIKHDITINAKRSLLQFPDLTVSINEIKPHNEPRRAIRTKKLPVYSTKKQVIQPNKQSIIECTLSKHTEDLRSYSGLILPCVTLERETDFAITSSLSTIGDNNIIFIAALNITDHAITLTNGTEIARFQILSSDQADKLVQVDPELIAFAKSRNSENFLTEINQLIQDSDRKGKNQPPRPLPDYASLWFPTPETCESPEHCQHCKNKYMTR